MGKGKREKGKGAGRASAALLALLRRRGSAGAGVSRTDSALFSFPFSLFLFLAALLLPAGNFAEEKTGLGTGHGVAETIEAIEKARVVTRVLYVTAHPDDESGAVLAWMARGAHADVALLSLTRGEGGQNALGPEQAPQLGLLRTEEMLEACRIYGVKLYFGGAADFGFSKNPEEALKVWGEPVLANMVRVIREFRPHIVMNNWGGVRSGHGQHQATGILTPQAIEAAADATKFAEQIAGGLQPWKVERVLQFARGAYPGATGADAAPVSIPSQETSPVWGRSYNEIGVEGYTQHRTQGVAQVGNSPFARGSRSVVSTGGPKIAPADFSRTLKDVAAASERDAKILSDADAAIGSAAGATAGLDWKAAADHLAQAGRLLHETPFAGNGAGARDDIKRALARIDHALALVAGLRVVARAERGEIVPGTSFNVDVEWQARESNVQWLPPQLALPAGWSASAAEKTDRGLRFKVSVPAAAKPDGAFYMGIAPWPAPHVLARMQGKVNGYTFTHDTEVTAQRVTTTRIDTLPVIVAPAVTLTPDPRSLALGTNRAQKPFEVVVRVRYYGTAAAEVPVTMDSSVGWKVSPPVKVKFEGAGDQLVKFTVTPPAKITPGEYPVGASAQIANTLYNTSLEPLPTLPTRLWLEPATVRIHAFPVNVPAMLRVGYVAAENDPIPDALRQIGVLVDLLDENALAFGDLKKYDAIAIGIRAYELRQDLIRANRRLLDYAAGGGTLLVQYQRESVWDALKPAPYPAAMNPPRSGESPLFRNSPRVTVEDSPVKILAPAHPLLATPNKIGAEDFGGWVQERGLSYWAQFDAKYTPLLGMNDPGEPASNGALVAAQYGKGVYIYTGLSLFRQIPAGVPGAYRLLVNLLSATKMSSR